MDLFVRPQTYDPNESDSLRHFFYALGKQSASLLHALASPIMTIIIDLDGLQTNLKNVKKDKEAKMYLKRLASATDQVRMLMTRDPLLVHATPSEMFDSSIVVRQICEYYQLISPRVSFRLSMPYTQLLLKGSAPVLFQILDTVLKNAIQACEQSKVAPKKVTTHLEIVENDWRISITDNGVGMPPELIEQLKSAKGFSKSKKLQGHGMGLYLTKRLIEHEFQGKMEITSQLGTGTTITITLPFSNSNTSRGN